MRTIFALLAVCFLSPSCFAQDGDWIGDVQPAVEPVADDLPNSSILEKLAELQDVVSKLEKIVELVAKQEPQTAMPSPQYCDCEELQKRIEALEGRMDTVEEQISALVTVRQEDGTETTSAVEIDTVEGYGDFEVPLGGKVVAIDGVRIRNHFSTPEYPIHNTPTYLAAPIQRPRTIRIAPIQRAVSVFSGRYYTDADGCTVDRITGQKVSCPAR